MKHILHLLIFTLICTNTFAQEKLVKDIDFDGKNDTIYFDKAERIITCQLSSKKV